MRYVLALCLLTLTACSTMSRPRTPGTRTSSPPRERVRTGRWWSRASPRRASPATRTTSSGASERPVFEKCFAEKSAPIWKAYCGKEPSGAGCAGR
jgi:hypothetical protein